MTECIEAILDILTRSYRYGKTFDKEDPERLARAAVGQARAHSYTLPQPENSAGQPSRPAPSTVATEPELHPADCPECGTPNPPGSLFCGACGRRLRP